MVIPEKFWNPKECVLVGSAHFRSHLAQGVLALHGFPFFFGTCVAFSLASAVDGWCAPFLVKVCATFLCGDLVLWKR